MTRRPCEYAGSVWVTGQVPAALQRRGRYRHDTVTHPAKMLPTIAQVAVTTYTQPGDLVLDPMAGIGTTLIEAIHTGRHAIGVECEPHWVRIAERNIALATAQGATGTARIVRGDARNLTGLLPDLAGQVTLVVTSPPYGPYAHGLVHTPDPATGKVRRSHSHYGHDRTNLAHQPLTELRDGFADILTGCRHLLAPGGYVVISTRPYRHHGHLTDVAGLALRAAQTAGLRPVEHCAALIAGIRHGQLITRGSFFQRTNITHANSAGDPQALIQHETVLIARNPQSTTPAGA